MKLEGKVALVTGGTRNIGRVISLTLAREGAKIAANYLSDDDAADRTVEEIREMGQEAVAIKADVGKIKQCKELVKKTTETYGQVDIFVSNAAIGQSSDIVDTPDEEWEGVINVNLRATFALARELMPGMMERKYGRVVTITSILAFKGGGFKGGGVRFASKATYSASKAGLIAFTKGIAHEGGPYITANVISPAAVSGDLRPASERGEEWPPEPNLQDDKWLKWGVPLNRRAVPEDIAEALLFLVSDSACFITGQTIHVGGGYMMP